MASVQDKLSLARLQVEFLKEQIAKAKAMVVQQAPDEGGDIVGQFDESCKGLKIPNVAPHLHARRTLAGHTGKVYGCAWGHDNRTCVSVAYDARAIVWDALAPSKLLAIPLGSAWVMACDLCPNDKLVATAGLDNVCSLHSRQAELSGRPLRELAGHSGYVSSVCFVGARRVLTASGDTTCRLWDVETGAEVRCFEGHKGDVMSVSVHPSNPNVFVSGACDTKCLVWDMRWDKPGRVCTGHESDVNGVQFFPGGMGVGSVSDDSSCKLFDVGTGKLMRSFAYHNCGLTSVAFSRSGRFLFAGADDFNVVVCDVLTGHTSTLRGHHNRVSCLRVSRNGGVLLTGSWDSSLKAWA